MNLPVRFAIHDTVFVLMDNEITQGIISGVWLTLELENRNKKPSKRHNLVTSVTYTLAIPDEGNSRYASFDFKDESVFASRSMLIASL